jgi:hypothetical protein
MQFLFITCEWMEFQPKWEKFGTPPRKPWGPTVEKHCITNHRKGGR